VFAAVAAAAAAAADVIFLTFRLFCHLLDCCSSIKDFVKIRIILVD
jgi:hypothetical protein